MPDDRVSRTALAVSILLHAALAAPVWSGLLPAGLTGSTPPPAETREPLTFHFVDPQPETPPPDAPAELVSTTDARAQQPDAPAELPPGAAFSVGRTPVPVTPRPAGAPDAGATPRAAIPPAERPADRAGEERAERGNTGRPTGGATLPDPRLAIPRDPIQSRSGRPAPPGSDRLPVPEVDQRLTRATAGQAFSLNTTAWDFAPYMERLKRAVEEHISPPAAFYYGTAGWVTRVRFRIEPDGRLSRVELLDHAGVSNLQYVSTDAIRGAADYEPLPPDFPAPYLEVTGHFYFNVMPER